MLRQPTNGIVVELPTLRQLGERPIHRVDHDLGEREQLIASSGVVDRKNPDRAGILRRWRALVGQGLSLIIFPEGTRSPDGKVGLFKAGSFLLAIEAQLPIVPLSIDGTRFVMRKGRLTTCPGHATLVVHQPIDTSGLAVANARELAGRVRAIVAGAPIVDRT